MKFKMMMTIIMLSIFVLTLGCTSKSIEDITAPTTQEKVLNQETIPEESVVNKTIEIVEEETKICANNADCLAEEVCIDGKCGTINQLYKTKGCEEKCNFNNIEIATSDGNSFTLSRGKGDYTSAGAIEWIISTGPDYCKGEKIIVPVKILKKNLGKVLSEQYITLGVGEESPLITHPTVKSAKFTFKINKVEEICN